MPDKHSTIVRKVQPVPEHKFHAAMMLDIQRMIVEHGRDAVASAIGVGTRQLGNLANGSFPRADHLWNLKALDPGALQTVESLYRSDKPSPANDMDLAAGLGHSLSELIDRLRDGEICHLDTLALAELFRRDIPRMQAIIDKADELRGVA